MEIQRCILCNLYGRKLYTIDTEKQYWKSDVKGVFEYFVCQKCGLIWLGNVPDNLHELYEKTSQMGTHVGLKNIEYDAIEKSGFKKKIKFFILEDYGYKINSKKIGFFEKFISKLLSSFHFFKFIVGRDIMFLRGEEKGKILDVGCGNGNFLYLMKRLGWDTFGVETDKVAAQIAAQHGLNVFCGDIYQANFPDNYFDAVTMNHVIEHVVDPKKVLLECSRILKKGGKIAIATPNIRSFFAQFYKQNYISFWPPYHIFHFSPNNLKKLVESVGYRILMLETFWLDPFLTNSKLCYFANKKGFGSIINRICYPSIYRAFPDWMMLKMLSLNGLFKFGNEIFIMAQKL